MATDIEESDRISPKRQRTLTLPNTDDVGESFPLENERRNADAESQEASEEEVRKWELKLWQARQFEKAFMDNAINEMMENLIGTLNPSEYPRLNLLRRVNHMENEAVSMAIRNHGLVCLTHSDPRSSQTHSLINDVSSRVRCAVENRILCSAKMTKSLIKANKETTNSSASKNYESDQRQDLLEHAVAAAIKKKGLSALTVDYG